MSQKRVEDQQSDFLILRWWLTERRRQLNYSWRDIAQIAETTPQKVQKWAEGQGLPDRDQLFAIARHLRDPDHPPGAEPLPEAPVDENAFVVASNGLGIGKCFELDDTTAKVEYFDTVAERVERTISVDDLRVVRLANQTRCYVREEGSGRWRMGRVERLGDGGRIIAFPDEEAGHVDQENLYVRWSNPVDDPIEILKQKGQETVFFRNRREPFVRTLLRQRAASRGASGLLSSSIDLYPHQVEVIRRILEDPIQRYLLADEVGLGKTIEAGVVIRQFLLDHENGCVWIFVPPTLRAQWRREMEDKFDVAALEGRVKVFGLNEFDDVGKKDAPDVLVIDEAHRVANWAFSDEEKHQSAFSQVVSLAHEVKRLFLLSATPAHRHEEEYLAMLHLLDPQLYSLDDIEVFKERVQKRTEVGGLLRDLVEGEDAFPLRMAINDLREAFPEDPALNQRANELEEVLSSDPISGRHRDELIRDLRLHLKERYRLHHRMLRSRRAKTSDDVDTTRSAPRFPEWGMDPREGEVHDLLDQWRLGARSASEYEEEVEARYVQLFQTLFETAGSDLVLLADVVRMRLRGDQSERLKTDLAPEEQKEVVSAPIYDGEEKVLRELLEATKKEEAEADRESVWTKKEWLEQFLNQHVGGEDPDRCVVFVNYPSVALNLHERLSEVFGSNVVAMHYADSDPEDAENNVRRFREDEDCRVLVCDHSAEEGRNLQFADHLVHYDLPWAPNRIEQRSGRLDRIGRKGRDMHTHVYLPDVETGSIFEAWYRLLNEGFNVFETSIADLQFLAEDLQPKLSQDLFRSGAEHVDEQVQNLRERIDQEREKLEQQHQFEELETYQQGADTLFDDLRNLELETGRIHSDLDGWISEALHFHQNRKPFPPGMLQYQPDFNGKTLIPFNTVMNRFLPRSDKPITYQRSRAVNSREETGVAASLFRIGHPFLNSLYDYFRWDDRGRTYAVWRQSETWNALGGEDRLFFRFEFVVEADVQSESANTDDAGRQAALQRRADALFAPRFETVITDRSGVEVANEKLEEIVKAKPHRVQDGGMDTNVKGDRLHLLDRFIDPLDWGDHCQNAREAAEEALMNRKDLVQQCLKAKERAEKDSQERIQRLQIRAAKEYSVGDQEEAYRNQLQREEHVADVLQRGIEEPSIRLDSVGVIIISGSKIPSSQ